jgi:lysozyme family protein
MSAAFESAYRHTVEGYEGGYLLSIVAGEDFPTYAGIARKFHPQWAGWALLDDGEPVNSPQLIELTKQFYFTHFWAPSQHETLENLQPRVSMHVFDFAVNSGWIDAVRALQRATGVADDGILGPKTCGVVRSAEAHKLLNRFFAQRSRHYAKTPRAKRANLGGWFNRLADELERASQ